MSERKEKGQPLWGCPFFVSETVLVSLVGALKSLFHNGIKATGKADRIGQGFAF